MRLLRGTPHVPGPSSDEPTVDLTPDRCIACLRAGQPVAHEVHYGVEMTLCVDYVLCRLHRERSEAA